MQIIVSCSDVSQINSSFTSVKLGLLNDDNILDVAFAAYNELDNLDEFVRTCIGNGDGTFSNCSNNYNIPATDIELGEFGDFDLIFANGFEIP